MIQILKMAFRDLGRNRRRSFFSALAVGAGLALLILMASVIEGEMGSAIESAIKLQSGISKSARIRMTRTSPASSGKI